VGFGPGDALLVERPHVGFFEAAVVRLSPAGLGKVLALLIPAAGGTPLSPAAFGTVRRLGCAKGREP
jgi:hypothetical protein